MSAPIYIGFFDEICLSDASIVGGKNASLGEMYQHLKSNNVRVPYGFAVKINAYESFIEYNNLKLQISDLQSQLDSNDLESLSHIGNQIRQLIINSKFPQSIQDEIITAYRQLCSHYNTTNVDVAIRSSSISEDSTVNSYAGQQDTYLNISGESEVLEHIKKCYASLYTDRAISYRIDKNESDDNIKMSVAVQKMVRSDLACSGVAFTIDVESGFKNAIIINGSYGLGELIVGGQIDPDEYIFFKTTKSIIDKKLGSKRQKMIYNNVLASDQSIIIHKESTLCIDTTETERNNFCLQDNQIHELCQWALNIEDHYTLLNNGIHRPMDIEWAVDGLSNELFIVQARPLTTLKDYSTVIEYKLVPNQNRQALITGIAVGDKIAVGKTQIITDIHDSSQVSKFQRGDILVVDSTSPDWEPIMKLASAIVTNRGGRTCHSAIICREIGIPAIVGCGTATEILQSDMNVTVCCSEGEIGTVYKDCLLYNQNHIDLNTLYVSENPKVMFNLASPEIAFKTAMLPNSGVGLAREEFIINNFIGIHPLTLLNYDKQSPDLKTQIDKLIIGYNDPVEYYVSKLAFGVAKIAAAFFPNDVILRFSDFKTNEYRNLLGGFQYEPIEENPLIGFRGMSRYYSKEFEPAFGLECLAIKRVRDEMGLTNVAVMFPFCRTTEELEKVYIIMKKYGLVRGVNGLRTFLMAEIPSNVILADEFSKMIDGFSIGSNDLTQLVLGLDRDSHLVAHLYDERNPAVKKMIKKVIHIAKKNGVKVGLCGQVVSDRPEFAEFLVECGIDSFSITPDSLIKVSNTVHQIHSRKNSIQ